MILALNCYNKVKNKIIILCALPASQETFLNKQNAFLPSFNKLVKPLHPCNIWHIVLSCATIKINQIILLMNCKKLHCAYNITTFNETRYNNIIIRYKKITKSKGRHFTIIILYTEFKSFQYQRLHAILKKNTTPRKVKKKCTNLQK